MKTYIKYILAAVLTLPMLSSCLDEETPTNGLTKDQLNTTSGTIAGLSNAVAKQMISMGTSYNACGFAGQMIELDAMTGQIPVYSTGYDYFMYFSEGNYLGPTYAYSYDTWRLYYNIIDRANRVMKADSTAASPSDENALYVGSAYGYRAMAYFILAQLYEFVNTGYTQLDADATTAGVKGLTVPIVTQYTTQAQSYNNPRVPYYTLYRFILTDLNKAETLLNGVSRDNINQMNESVVYGLKARFWLTLGSRFEEAPDDLTEVVSHESDASLAKYDQLGVTSAKECFQLASKYAQLAESGYTPMTRSQWYDGFNKTNDAWMFAVKISADDMTGDSYWSWDNFISFMSSETQFGIGGPVYKAYREIDAGLYTYIDDADWRKKTWVSPDDAGDISKKRNYTTILADSDFAKVPAYAGLKFKPGDNNQSDYTVGAAVAIPLMRVEEMYFIDAEATAHVDGVAAGETKLNAFMNTYRCTATADDPTPYNCSESTLEDFTRELIRQKRIEFWGEGLTYFDYKRLRMGFTLKYDGSNHPDNYQYNFDDGYVAPAMNFCITRGGEAQYNTAIINNPDPSGYEAAGK